MIRLPRRSIGFDTLCPDTTLFRYNFVELLVARIGLGIGEAGGTPASQSSIADMFPFSERVLATTIFALGAAAGSLLGAVAGGAIAEAYGWRWEIGRAHG